MDKIEGKYNVGLQYTKRVEGLNTFSVLGVDYTFIDVGNGLSGLNLAKNISLLSDISTVKFKDYNKVHIISIDDFNILIKTIMLSGNELWEKKITKYSLIELAKTEDEILDIVNSKW